MTTSDHPSLAPVLELLRARESPAWRKCVITPAKKGADAFPWDRFAAQPVALAAGLAVKVVTRVGRREATHTYPLGDWPQQLDVALGYGPCHLNVLARDHDWHARLTRDGKWLVSRARPSIPPEAAPEVVAAHDRSPNYPLPAEDERVRRLFVETGLFGKSGALLGAGAAKYRQVQHFIELLRPLNVWQQNAVRVLDAGCGKAYLSLALCLWAEREGVRVGLTGVDRSGDLMTTVQGIAAAVGIGDARFVASDVAEYAASNPAATDLLVSLHACDTATDEALAAGVSLGASAIVLVPCCHQELSDQMEAAHGAPAAATWAAATRSGLLQHRLADIVTDSLRAAALEALGYSVDVIEFVSPEATARNLMIRAEKPPRPNVASQRDAYARYRSLADAWQVSPALERLLGVSWPPRLS